MRNICRALAMAGVLLGPTPGASAATSDAAISDEAPYTVDRRWETDDGLPQSSVIAMTQARDGYLWLGTLNGLVRFDGIHFAVFDENNTPGLKSSRVVSLFEDSRGQLWIGTETAGVALAKEGRVISLDIGRQGREGRLLFACEDSRGAVWLYTASGELCRHDQGQVNVWHLDTEAFGQPRAAIAESTGAVWIGTQTRLATVDPASSFGRADLPLQSLDVRGGLDSLVARPSGGHWRLVNRRIQLWNANHLERDLAAYPWGTRPVSATCTDHDGNLIVGTLGAGVFWFDASGGVHHLSTKQELSNNYVLSLVVDREGSLWVGTDGGGLNRARRQRFATLESSRGLTVQSTCADAEGGVWIGYNDGGIDHWSEGRLTRLYPVEGFTNLPVRAVLADQSGRVWAGTLRAGLRQLQDGAFSQPATARSLPPDILALHQDRQGRLWVGTESGLACHEEPNWRIYTTRDGLVSPVVRAIADDAEGRLWIGTVGGGLHCLKDGQIVAFGKAQGFPSDHISSLHVDAAGVLWVGTDGGGLVRMHEGRWKQYTVREGLQSNSIGYLLEDLEGFLWIGSHAGLMRVPKQALNELAGNQQAQDRIATIPCRTYERADGLPTCECSLGSQPGACRTTDGRLWFPTIKGLAFAHPDQLRPNTTPPPVAIEAVLVDGQPQNTNGFRVPWPDALHVPPRKERIEIHYTSLNLAAPDRARFRYRLHGHESSWIDAGERRSVPYSQLPPGEYRFEVTACNEDGVWNPVGQTLAIVVAPPFWRTWWFLGITSASLLGLLIGAVHFFSTQRLHRQLARLEQQQALERDRSRIARDLHDQLGASLTQIALLGELAEADKDAPAAVEEHARQISQSARDTTRVLDEIVWAVNPSNDTLDGLVTYFCKHAQEFLAVAGISHRLDLPAHLPATPLPPEVRHNVFLAAKEAVTNVARHSQASSVRIRLHLEPASFTLEIEDNGRGIDPALAHNRNGLRNMRKRIEEIGGRFEIGSGAEKGTRVRITAPWTRCAPGRDLGPAS